MSKQVNISEVMEMLKNNSKGKSGLRTRNNVKYTKMIPEEINVSLPPQAIELVGIILNDSNDSWTEPELQKLIDENSEVLKTKQEPWKIFQYYRKALIDAGFLVMEK